MIKSTDVFYFKDPDSDQEFLQPGDIIAGYLLVRRLINRGGFGQVYLVTDIRASVNLALKADGNIEGTKCETYVMQKFQVNHN